MGKYLINRILRGILSIIAVVALVMILVYSMLDRTLLFKVDNTFVKTAKNQRQEYMYNKWEEYGYLDCVTYADYLKDLTKSGEIDEETRAAAVAIARTPDKDQDLVKEYVEKFTQLYQSKGYTIHRLDAVMASKYSTKLANGGEQKLFATKDIPLIQRLIKYFTGIIEVDNIHYATGDVGERGLTFTLHDPLYNGKFAPAIIGNGTKHKYLLYVNNEFPYIHQNLAILRMGTSYTVNNGVDVFDTMSRSQGAYILSETTLPTGFVEQSADDLHTATYREGSRTSNPINEVRFTDDYTNIFTVRGAPSKLGFSFINGIISVVMAYLIGIPVGVAMARKKDRLVDKIGTMYIIFIIAVPSLAYIFLFKAVGGQVFGLPTLFDMEANSKAMYILPIISLALPSIAGLMKWMRRYMIDQMNSDYVKFARSGGLTEKEIFNKHILKNAAIPIVHGIPGSVIFAMTGAIITERVYVVPGAGNLLTEAINKYDNSVIVGMTMFYSVLSVTSIILGDLLMAAVDPRISFTSKAR